MSKLQTPFRYDFVGSFLRPQALKDAKAAYRDGKITKEEFDKVVNEEITKVVAKQKELGFHAITESSSRMRIQLQSIRYRLLHRHSSR